MASLTKRLHIYSDGSFRISHGNLPNGYFLAQIGEHQQAASGNPAVIVLRDLADTVFNDQLQLALYAWNFGMLKNNVSHLMGYMKAYMNKTGTGNPDSPKRNVILEEDMDSPVFPWLDKLRTDALNCHAVRNYDDKYYQVWTMDGTIDPPMREGSYRPSSIDDIDSGRTKPTDYLIRPETHLFAFVIPNNFNDKGGGVTTISPFAGGIKYPWTPDPDEIYTFFPLISRKKEPVLSEKRLWTPVSGYNIPYRRV